MFCRFKYDLCIVENVSFLSALFGHEYRIYIIFDEYISAFIYSSCLLFYNILGPKFLYFIKTLVPFLEIYFGPCLNDRWNHLNAACSSFYVALMVIVEFNHHTFLGTNNSTKSEMVDKNSTVIVIFQRMCLKKLMKIQIKNMNALNVG